MTLGPTGDRELAWGSSPATVPLLALALLACAAAEPPATPSASPAAKPGRAASTPMPDPSLTGYPWARLVDRENPVEPLDFALPAASLATLGVKSSRSYAATTPRIWLLAFEFETQSQLLDAEPGLLELIEDGPPHHAQTAHTGAWLLVAGFPDDKPVSPQMQSAIDAFRSAWAGEE